MHSIRIGKRLRELRLEHGDKQDHLAQYLLVDRAVIANYENDKRDPAFDVVVALCDYFGVTVDYMLYRPGAIRDTAAVTAYKAAIAREVSTLPREAPPQQRIQTAWLATQEHALISLKDAEGLRPHWPVERAARRMGLSEETVEAMLQGSMPASGPFLAGLAAITGIPERWFTTPSSADLVADLRHRLLAEFDINW